MHTDYRLTATPDARPARPFPMLSFGSFAMVLCLSGTLSASPVQMDFVGVNGTQAFGYEVGPYSGLMDGQPVELFCVDFANEVHLGQTWDANLTAITLGSDLSNARYGGRPDALEHYRQAAWLTLQFGSQPPREWGDLAATIWQIFSTAGPTPSTSYWMDQAQANFVSTDYSAFRIVTNLAPVEQFGQVQEFLVRIQDAPEPSSQLSMGLALVGGSFVWRRFRGARRRRGRRQMALCYR